jgi:hypothetical protein
MKHVLKHFPQAAAEAARSMTYDLRNSAIEHGWNPEIANSLRVTHTGSAFKVHVPKKHRKTVHELEYGTESSRPTAVLRKFNNRPEYMEKAFMKSMSRLTGGKL